MAEPLLVERRGKVAVLTLNRPEIRNAFDDALVRTLAEALARLEADASVRALVLAGSGTAFCAGADLHWMKRVSGYDYAQNLADARALATMLARLDRLAKPVLARVHGPAFAGGVGLVAACDIAIGSTEAAFALTEVKIGLSPATISPYVVRAIGARAARRYFLTGERFGAEEAHRLGLLHKVCAPERLDAEVEEILGHLVAGGPEAQRRIKELVAAVAPGGAPHEALVEDTARRIAAIRVSPEGREGVAAFLEKRRPRWAAPEAD